MAEWADVTEELNGIGAETKLQFVDHGKYRIFRLITMDPKDGTLRVVAMTAVKDRA